MPVNWKDHIVSTPDVLRGKPRLKRTRVPVSLILGYLATGYTFEGIAREFPDLRNEQIAACREYIPPDSPDPVVITTAQELGAILISLLSGKFLGERQHVGRRSPFDHAPKQELRPTLFPRIIALKDNLTKSY